MYAANILEPHAHNSSPSPAISTFPRIAKSDVSRHRRHLPNSLPRRIPSLASPLPRLLPHIATRLSKSLPHIVRRPMLSAATMTTLRQRWSGVWALDKLRVRLCTPQTLLRSGFMSRVSRERCLASIYVVPSSKTLGHALTTNMYDHPGIFDVNRNLSSAVR